MLPHGNDLSSTELENCCLRQRARLAALSYRRSGLSVLYRYRDTRCNCRDGARSSFERGTRLGQSKPGAVAGEVAGVELMNFQDKFRTIVKVEAQASAVLLLQWSDGTKASLDLSRLLEDKAFHPLRDPEVFVQAKIGEWGHSIKWPSGIDLGAETLWLETLSASGHQDTREFLEWRLQHGLSLSKTADALGLSRRMVAYYSNGEKPVPKSILLACRGWEAGHAV